MMMLLKLTYNIIYLNILKEKVSKFRKIPQQVFGVFEN
jgi:hypothetical protein